MTNRRRARGALAGSVALCAAAACATGTDDAPPDVTYGDTARSVEVPLGDAPAGVPLAATDGDDLRWAASLGGAVVVAADPFDESAAVRLVRTDAATAAADTAGLGERLGEALPLELFGRAGLVGRATLSAVVPGDTGAPDAAAGDPIAADSLGAADTAVCVSWPAATVRIDTAVAPDGWQLALPASRAAGIPLTPIATFATRDSATFAAALTRFASLLPDSAGTPFRGLPFVVRQAYRAPPEEGLLLAVLVRTFPQEAEPLEERTLLVVRTPTDSTARDPRRWRLVWSERLRGAEAALTAADPVALLRLTATNERVVAVLEDDGSTRALALLAESADTGDADGTWRVRWRRRVAGCR